jgi:hypothetical protein
MWGKTKVIFQQTTTDYQSMEHEGPGRSLPSQAASYNG